jgi:hypothetical protein
MRIKIAKSQERRDIERSLGNCATLENRLSSSMHDDKAALDRPATLRPIEAAAVLANLVHAAPLKLGRLLQRNCRPIDGRGAAPSQCCIGESELTCDLDPLRLVLGTSGRARLRRTAAEIIRIASHVSEVLTGI